MGCDANDWDYGEAYLIPLIVTAAHLLPSHHFQDCLQSHPEHQKSIIESATESTEEQESKAPEAAATTATA